MISTTKSGLFGVTFTGADDNTNPQDLHELSSGYPFFVEWGILYGVSPRPRFPSTKWIDQLETHADFELFSLHLCSSPLQKLLNAGVLELEERWLLTFRRLQLNFHGGPVTEEQSKKLVSGLQESPWAIHQIIVQLDGKNDWIVDRLLDVNLDAAGLYDHSHGAGIKPDQWPTPNAKWSVGFAGGLSHENIADELSKINTAANGQKYWIDMETHIRSIKDGKDILDLKKCRTILDTIRVLVS